MRQKQSLLFAFLLVFMVSCGGGGSSGELPFDKSDVPDAKGSDVADVPDDPEAPSAPSDLSAELRNATSVRLTWMGSTDNVGVSGYKVFDQSEEIGTAATLTFNHDGLPPGSTHCYRVKAFDLAGNVSTPSNEACITTPEDVPDNPDVIVDTVVEDIPNEISDVPAGQVSAPVSLAIEQGGNTALVCNASGLFRINVTSRVITKTITLSLNEPRGLAIETGGTSALVVESGAGSLSRINLDSGAITTVTTGLHAPHGLAIEASGETALVSDCGETGCDTTGRVVRVDLNTGDISLVTPTGLGLNYPAGIAIEPGGTTALLAEQGGWSPSSSWPYYGRLLRIALDTPGIATVVGGLLFPQAVAIEPDSDGKSVLVTNGGRIIRVNLTNRAYTVINNEKPIYTINWPSGPYDLAIEPGGKTALVVDGSLELVLRVNIDVALYGIAPAANAVTTFLSPSGMALESATTAIVIDGGADEDNGRVLRVNLETGGISVIATGLYGLAPPFTGIAIEPGGATALVFLGSTCFGCASPLVRVHLSGPDVGTFSTVADGVYYPYAIASETNHTVLVSSGNVGLVRVDLDSNTKTTVAQFSHNDINKIVIEQGGATALVTSDYLGRLYRVDLDGTLGSNVTVLADGLDAGSVTSTSSVQIEDNDTALVLTGMGRLFRVNLATGGATLIGSANGYPREMALEASGTSALVLVADQLIRLGFQSLSTPTLLARNLNYAGPIAVESTGSSALFLDCDPNFINEGCATHGRLMRVDLSSGALNVLASGLNRQYRNGGLAIEDTTHALVTDCGASSSYSCNSMSRLLRIPLNGGDWELLTGDHNVLEGIAIKSGGGTALVAEKESGNLLNISLDSGMYGTVASGLSAPSHVSVEFSDATALVTTSNALLRVALKDGTSTTIISLANMSFVVEPGGATALLIGQSGEGGEGRTLYRLNLSTGALDVLGPGPGLFDTSYGLAVTPDGATLLVTEARTNTYGSILKLPVPQLPAPL